MPFAPQGSERRQQLRHALALVDVPEAADERRSLHRCRHKLRDGPRGMLDALERPVVPVLAHQRLDVARVDDDARRAVEHLARERELLRADLPQRRHASLQHPVAEQPAGHARLALHGGQVCVPVVAADRQTGDEVVDHEVVQDDDAGTALERIDDPAVRIGIVADVVERDVRVGHGTRASRPHDLDVDQLLERRQEQRRVVGDPRRRRRQR